MTPAPLGERRQRGVVWTVGGPDAQRSADDVIGDRPHRGAPVPVDRGFVDPQQVRQASARRGLGAPGQFVSGEVEHERDLHHGHLGRAVEHRAERVRGEDPLLPPQPADPLAALGNAPKTTYRGLVAHHAILPHDRLASGRRTGLHRHGKVGADRPQALAQ